MAKKRLNIKTLRKKLEEKSRHDLYKYEQDYIRNWYIKQNDKLASTIVRFRDCWSTKVACVTQWIKVCKWPVSYKTSQCCHWISRKYYSCRRDLRNMYAGCGACNCYGLQDHHNAITARIIEDHGREARNQMRNSRSMRKPDYVDLVIINEELKQKAFEYGFDI